jgi:hypothetical protein
MKVMVPLHPHFSPQETSVRVLRKLQCVVIYLHLLSPASLLSFVPFALGVVAASNSYY